MNTGQLTSKSELIRNGIWNLLGHSPPLLIGIVAFPILIGHLGKDRFGIISIGWAIILWSGLLAQGISLALTKRISEISCSQENEEIPFLAGTAILLLFLFGFLECLFLVGITPWLTHSALNIPANLRRESLAFFYLLASLIPFANLSICLIGILEGQHKFRWINYVRIPTSFLILLGPILVLPFTKSLPWVLASVLVVLIISVGVLWLLTVSTMPTKRFSVRLKKSELSQLAHFGKWIVLGNSLGILTNDMATFFIGALLTLSAVTYYATPQQVVMGLFIVPIALAQVMFPAFTSSIKSDPQKTLKLYNGAFKFLYLIIFPIIFSLITFAPEGLRIWLGPDFANTSGPVLRWLALGVFIASATFLPGTLIRASGRPDLLAKLQLIMFPLFIMALFGSTKYYGIQGAAITFSGQFLISGMMIFYLGKRIYSPLGQIGSKPIYILGVGILCFLIVVLFNNLIIRSMIWLTILLLFSFSMWRLALKPEDREFLIKRVQPS